MASPRRLSWHCTRTAAASRLLAAAAPWWLAAAAGSAGVERWQHRRSRSRGSKSLRRLGKLGSHVDFGEAQIRLHFGKRRERSLALNQCAEVGEPVVEAAKDVEDQRAVTNRFAEVRKLVDHGLESVAVIGDGQAALDEGAELGVKEKSTTLLVSNELLLEAKPHKTSSGRVVIPVHDNLEELGIDRAVEPGQDCAIHALPHGVVGAIVVGKHMINKRIALKSVEEEATPSVEMGRREVEDDGDERLDVEDRRCMSMKSSSSRGDLASDDEGMGVGVASLLLQTRSLSALSLDARSLQARSFLASSLAAFFSSEGGNALLQSTTGSGGSCHTRF
jgi:hypothetical protein